MIILARLQSNYELWIDIVHLSEHFNSFTANVADRGRHSRLPASPIGDLDPLP